MVTPMQFDRHLTISAGWVAGPAFGIAMMAAPEYLGLNHATAPYFFWGGIAVFVLTIGRGIHLWARERGGSSRVLFSALMTIGLLLFAIGVTGRFWLYRNPQVAAAISNPLDNTVRVDCERSDRLAIGHPDRSIYLLQIGDPFLPDGSENRFSPAITTVPPKSASEDLGNIVDRDFGMCRITNFGAKPLFGVQVNFVIIWTEDIKQANGSRSGKEIHRKAFKSPAVDIGTSPKNEEIVYFMNNTNYWVQIGALGTISTYSPDNPTPSDVKIIQTAADSLIDKSMFFRPRTAILPPAKAPDLP